MTVTLPISSTTRTLRSVRPADRASTAGEVVLAYIAAQVDTVRQQQELVRAFDADAVHNTRAATRRLRGTLSTFRPLFDHDVIEPIRLQLAWLGGFLGSTRDTEVQRVRLLDAVAAEPEGLVMGPVAEHIDGELRREFRTAGIELLEALNSPRYSALLEALNGLLDHPPFTELADEPARPTLVRMVRRSWKRVRGLAEASAEADRADRERQLHEVRKAAKRLRYACEAVEPAFGKPAARLAVLAATWQSILGDHQDSVIARNMLRSMGSRMFLDGENPFTIGRLHALEQARADRAEEEFAESWHGSGQPKMRKWLDR